MPTTFTPGWRPDIPDQRDHYYAPRPAARRMLDPVVQLPAKLMPPIWDQGQLGSCTAHMACFLEAYTRAALRLPAIDPSRLATYWWTRYIEGGAAQAKVDSGATIRDAVKSLARYGMTTETLWPYQTERYARQPSSKAAADAAKRQVLTYERVAQDVTSIASAIADGRPVGLGIVVYPTALDDATAKTGAVPMPQSHEAPAGGHAVALTGYDMTTRRFTFRNSWGSGWGRKGYGTLPYEYVADPQLAGDMWTVRTVETG